MNRSAVNGVTGLPGAHGPHDRTASNRDLGGGPHVAGSAGRGSFGLAAAAVTLPAAGSIDGYICRLLINEVPFPGERGYTSEADTMLAMEGLLRVLDARLKHIPSGYTQQQIAAVRSDKIIDIITAGGVKGQFDGFYRDASGTRAMVPRITQRIDNLLKIAGRGQPRKFARLLEHAAAIARDYTSGTLAFRDPHKAVRVVNGVSATGRAYSWMTDEPQYNPGGMRT